MDQVEDEPELILETGAEAEIAAAISGARHKVDAVAHVLTEFETRAATTAAELDRLSARRNRFTRQADRLKAYVLRVMDDAGLKSLEGETSTLSSRRNAPAVQIADPAALPVEFLRIRTSSEPDKTAIGAALTTSRSLLRRQAHHYQNAAGMDARSPTKYPDNRRNRGKGPSQPKWTRKQESSSSTSDNQSNPTTAKLGR